MQTTKIQIPQIFLWLQIPKFSYGYAPIRCGFLGVVDILRSDYDAHE